MSLVSLPPSRNCEVLQSLAKQLSAYHCQHCYLSHSPAPALPGATTYQLLRHSPVHRFWGLTLASTCMLMIIRPVQPPTLKLMHDTAVWAQKMGVRLDLLKFCQPSSGDEALDMAAQLAGSGGIDIIVVDSVAALIPRTEIDGDIGQPTVRLFGLLWHSLGVCTVHLMHHLAACERP